MKKFEFDALKGIDILLKTLFIDDFIDDDIDALVSYLSTYLFYLIRYKSKRSK